MNRPHSPRTLLCDHIPFELGSRRIQLSGKKCPGQPEAVHGIKVNRTAAKLHFLHGCVDVVPEHGVAVGRYTLHYTDGTTAVIPVVSGRDLRDWWGESDYTEQATRAKVAWFGTNPMVAKSHRRLQIFLCTWSNPHPEKTIATIDFERGPLPYAAPFCMAITCDHDPAPLPPEPGLLNVNIGHYLGASRYAVDIADSPSSPVRGLGKHDVLLAPGRHPVEIRDGEKLIRRGSVKIEAGSRVDIAIDGPQVLFPLPTAQPDPVQELVGQSWGIRAIVLAHDGKTLATGAGDGTVILWSLKEGTWTKQATLSHDHSVTLVAFSPDARLLATGTDDGSVKLWNVADGQPIGILQQGRVKAYAVAFAPDGRSLVSGNDDGTVDVWNVETREKLTSVKCHEKAICRLAFSPDATLLATGGEDGTVKLWNAASWKLRHVMVGHTDYVSAIMFSPDGKTLASAWNDAGVRRWDVATGKLIDMFTHPQSLFALAFSPDGQCLAAAGQFHTVRIWDLASGKIVHDFHAHWGDISSLVFTPDGRKLLTASRDNSTRMWYLTDLPGPFPVDSNGPRPRTVFNIHKDWSMDVVFYQEADGLVAAVGAMPIAVQVRNLEDPSQLWKFYADKTENRAALNQSISFARNKSTLIMCISASGKPQISLWDTQKHIRQAVLEPSPGPSSKDFSNARMAVAADGTAIAVASSEERLISMIDLPAGITRWSVALPHDKPISPAISPDGRIVAVGTESGLIMLLNSETGKQGREPLRHGKGKLNAIAFSSGNILVSADSDGVATFWDMESFEGFSLPPAHHEAIYSAAFSPDGQLLATAGGGDFYATDPWAHEGEICLWDVKNRKLLVKFHAHYGCVTRAVFSPSGKMLATTGRDGKMCLWDVADVLK